MALRRAARRRRFRLPGRPSQRGSERAAWRCIGVTLLLWAAGDFYYTLFLLDSTVAPPTVTDWLWLVSYPILYTGIALLVRARTLHFERSLWLDAALAALAVAAIGAAVLSARSSTARAARP